MLRTVSGNLWICIAARCLRLRRSSHPSAFSFVGIIDPSSAGVGMKGSADDIGGPSTCSVRGMGGAVDDVLRDASGCAADDVLGDVGDVEGVAVAVLGGGLGDVADVLDVAADVVGDVVVVVGDALGAVRTPRTAKTARTVKTNKR